MEFEEQRIELETAKLAKEKGFIGASLGMYTCDNTDNVYQHNIGVKSYFGQGSNFLAPSQSTLLNWLWNKHRIHVEITLWGNGIGFTGVLKYIDGKDEDGSKSVYGTDIFSVYGDSYNKPMIIEKGLVLALNRISNK